jgi:hypothetical protein
LSVGTVEPVTPDEWAVLRNHLQARYTNVFTDEAIESHIKDYVGYTFPDNVAPMVAAWAGAGARLLDIGCGYGGFVLRAREFGLDAGLAIASADLAGLAPFVAEHTEGRGAEVALDLVGGPYLAATLGAMAPLGRVVLVGTMAGARGELDLGRILRFRLTLRGTVLRARPIEERITVTRRFASEVGPLLARRVVRPVIDARFPLDEIARAHERLESNETFGKVVLELDG